jgi:hypothetical protein
MKATNTQPCQGKKVMSESGALHCTCLIFAVLKGFKISRLKLIHFLLFAVNTLQDEKMRLSQPKVIVERGRTEVDRYIRNLLIFDSNDGSV